MTLPLAGIVAAYVVLAILLLSLNLTSRWRWWIKAGAIVVTSLFFAQTYASVLGLIGWPSTQRVPDNFQLHWARIVEPSPINDEDGAIFLWLEELDDNNIPIGRPRAFELPFSDDLAERVQQAQDEIKDGSEVAGSAEEVEDGEAEDQGSEAEANNRNNNELRMAEQSQARAGGGTSFDLEALVQTPQTSIQFHEMPGPALPPKTAE